MISFKTKKDTGDVPRRRRADTPEETPQTVRSGTQFRRGQTLSGLRQSTTMAESPRGKAHHLTIQRRKIGGLFVVALVAALLLTLLLTQLMAQVTVSSSTQQLSAAFEGTEYEKAINDYLGLNPGERLRFALNEQALSEFVGDQLPEVDSVEVSGVRGMVETQFAITFRKPVAGWQINGNQYYVDSVGVVFDRNYYETPGVQIIDESGISPEEGATVAGSRLLGFLGRVVAEAQGRGYVVTRATLPVGATRQIDISLENTTTRVKLSTDRGAGEQVEDMTRSLTFLNNNGIGAEYIDVRIAGRAAYR